MELEELGAELTGLAHQLKEAGVWGADLTQQVEEKVGFLKGELEHLQRLRDLEEARCAALQRRVWKVSAALAVTERDLELYRVPTQPDVEIETVAPKVKNALQRLGKDGWLADRDREKDMDLCKDDALMEELKFLHGVSLNLGRLDFVETQAKRPESAAPVTGWNKLKQLLAEFRMEGFGIVEVKLRERESRQIKKEVREMLEKRERQNRDEEEREGYIKWLQERNAQKKRRAAERLVEMEEAQGCCAWFYHLKARIVRRPQRREASKKQKAEEMARQKEREREERLQKKKRDCELIQKMTDCTMGN
ncbi:uncharacterized protein [Salminus brasiliensis]|uniref:uncharacterized protein n=1 Tax=Salminus brasiliensis TaxID=930266 RepID=UPI003B82C63E